jgi:hypothetical protein
MFDAVVDEEKEITSSGVTAIWKLVDASIVLIGPSNGRSRRVSHGATRFVFLTLVYLGVARQGQGRILGSPDLGGKTCAVISVSSCA